MYALFFLKSSGVKDLLAVSVDLELLKSAEIIKSLVNTGGIDVIDPDNAWEEEYETFTLEPSDDFYGDIFVIEKVRVVSPDVHSSKRKALHDYVDELDAEFGEADPELIQKLREVFPKS